MRHEAHSTPAIFLHQKVAIKVLGYEVNDISNYPLTF